MAEPYDWSMSRERLEEIVDAAFVRVCGQSYRPGEKRTDRE